MQLLQFFVFSFNIYQYADNDWNFQRCFRNMFLACILLSMDVIITIELVFFLEWKSRQYTKQDPQPWKLSNCWSEWCSNMLILPWFFIKRTLRISCIAPFSHQTNFRRNKRYAFCGRYTSQLRKKSTEKRAREAQTDRESERKQRIFYFQRITEFRLIYSDNFIPFNQASIYTVKYVSQQFCREHTLSIFVSMDRNSKRTKELNVRNWTFPKLLKDSEDEK